MTAPIQQGAWKRFDIGKNLWKYIYNSGGVNYIAMTGSDVVKQIKIPFSYRLVRLHLFHADSSDDASSTPLEITIERTSFPAPFNEYLFQEDQITASRFAEVFGEGFEYEGGTWKITLNGTNTDRIYPVIYIQEIGH